MNSKLIALEILSSDSYLVVNKKLVKRFGCSVAVFVSNLIDKYKYFYDKQILIDDGFYITHKKLIEEYGFNDRDIRNCKNILKTANIIELKRIGLPAKEYYYINWDNLMLNLNPDLNFNLTSATESVSTCATESVSTCATESVTTINNNKVNNNKLKLTSFEEEDNSPKLTRFITPNQFNNFWELYPKKAEKGKALTSWNKISTKKTGVKPTWRQIRNAIIAQKQTERWQNKDFIPLPTTWLNQSRWLDDPNEMKNFNYGNNGNGKTYSNNRFEPMFDEIGKTSRND
jgi:hypothetical protein